MQAQEVLSKALSGERLNVEDGVTLFQEGDLIQLGQVANYIRKQKHPENLVTFVIDRNINYTNVCTCRCKFCAFYCDSDSPKAFVLSDEEIFKKIEETEAVGGTQILMQGGLHPELPFEYYLNLLQKIKERFSVHIHSFSAPEIAHFAELSGLSIREVLAALQGAGLASLPGGGAEILDNRVRYAISPKKISWEKWMEVHTTAHSRGMKSTATMMFGSIETIEERVLHLIRVRDAQDSTGGFTAFIPWSFQPTNTELGGGTATGVEYLKTLAISRIILDNIPNIQASWVTQGAKMAQVSLSFGANDFGGTMLEENVVRAAGITNRVPLDEIIKSIKDAGYKPVQRTTLYQWIKNY